MITSKLTKKELKKIISKYLDSNKFKVGEKSECLKLIEAIQYSTLSGGEKNTINASLHGSRSL